MVQTTKMGRQDSVASGADPGSNEFTGDLDRTPIYGEDSSRVTGYAIIDAIVSPALDGQRASSGRSANVRALIDTGATTSAVDKTVAADLGLPVIGHETGIGMEGREIRIPLYHARVELPDLRRSWDTAILMETGAGQGLHDVVLGNDVLQSCVFILDGPAGKFILRCPG